MMSLLKHLKLVIFVLAAVLMLVIVRILDQNPFKERAVSALEIIRDNRNLITLPQLQGLSAPYLVIDLSNKPDDSIQFKHTIQISFEALLNEANRKAMNEFQGVLILYSEDVATISKAWIILNQLGYKNLLILMNDKNPEILKYKFQPDTTVRLEQDPM